MDNSRSWSDRFQKWPTLANLCSLYPLIFISNDIVYISLYEIYLASWTKCKMHLSSYNTSCYINWNTDRAKRRKRFGLLRFRSICKIKTNLILTFGNFGTNLGNTYCGSNPSVDRNPNLVNLVRQSLAVLVVEQNVFSTAFIRKCKVPRKYTFS